MGPRPDVRGRRAERAKPKFSDGERGMGGAILTPGLTNAATSTSLADDPVPPAAALIRGVEDQRGGGWEVEGRWNKR